MTELRACVACVMDTTDPDIRFDERGLCSHCRSYADWSARRPSPESRAAALERLLDEIRREGRGRDYDCLIGISGGVDSSYVAYKLRSLGLRALAMHFDSGWNSELAVYNIENLVKRLDLDLHTVVCDWSEMRDLQRAFFQASVVNCDVPQDHAFVAALLQTADRFGLRHVLSGHNTATEFVMPDAWRGHNSQDWVHIRGIHQRYGRVPLRRYPHFTTWQHFLYYPHLKRVRFHNVLESIPYFKSEAKTVLTAEIGWRDYGVKHGESRFTRFFQGCYLLEKFGFDKRKAHLSNLVITGQLSRDEALAGLKAPPLSPDAARVETAFVLKKLGLTAEEWDEIMRRPPRGYRDYPYDRVLDSVTRMHRGLARWKRRLLGGGPTATQAARA